MANPNTDRVIMGALATILPGYPTINTTLGSLGCPIVIQDEYALSTGKFPALHLEAGRQKHSIVTYAGYDGEVEILVTYFARWDTQSTRIDALRLQIDNDLQQMMTNVQANSSLILNGQAMAVAIPTIELSEYKGELDDKMVPGLSLVKRSMTLTVTILPYDVP